MPHRLADMLFSAARYANHSAGTPDVIISGKDAQQPSRPRVAVMSRGVDQHYAPWSAGLQLTVSVTATSGWRQELFVQSPNSLD
jgi:hypothetical protein